MANNLSAKIYAAIEATLTNVESVATKSLQVKATDPIVLRNGTGDDQADLIFQDQRTLAASTAEDLDLAGSLTDPFGAALTFVEVVAIIVRAAEGNTNDVVIGGDASAAFVGPFADASDKVHVKPGGVAMFVAPNTGWAVTATSADLLQVANGSSGSAVTYDITIIGRSA